MGAYLSGPKTDKDSSDELNDYLVVGASSMQGWRNSQEDAHNSILNFDAHTSFFAVYDGHGGAEVACYCAEKLPQFLKELLAYKEGRLESALQDAFLGFDKTLLEPEVIQALKALAGERNFVEPDDSDAMEEDEDYDDLVELHEESNLPLSEVLEKYKEGFSVPVSLKRAKDSADGAPHKWFYMRGRRAAAVAADAANKRVMDPESHPAGSSTSAAAAAAAASSGLSDNDAGPSSSKAALSKMGSAQPEDDSTVSSSSSSGTSKSNTTTTINNNKNNNNNSNNNNNNNTNTSSLGSSSTEAEASSSKVQGSGANGSACISPDSSYVKESEQNGNVTSSEAKADQATSSSASASPAAALAAAIHTSSTTTSASSNTTSSSSASPGPGAGEVVVASVAKMVASDETTVSASSDTVASKHNGNATVASSSNSSPRRSTISSTSTDDKSLKKSGGIGEDDSTDDDADYDGENSSCDEADGRPADYSSEEDVDDDDDEDEDEDDDYEEEEDEEAVFTRDRFCANMIEEPGKDSGCTAVVAVLRGRDLYVANAGDSRCVVCRNGKAIDMSLDHKPEDEEEASRIIKAGGRVTCDGRVNGGLNLSRALGDHAYKMNAELPAEEQMISALPDIKKLIITPEDEFMVLACDGIWNYMSSEEVVEFVRVRLTDDIKMSRICEELFDNCLAPNTMGDGTGCDNMTAVIVRFRPKLLELPTKINPEETEDVIIAKQAAAADAADVGLQKALKRCASPSSANENDMVGSAVVTKIKRMKTDGNDGVGKDEGITPSMSPNSSPRPRSNNADPTEAVADTISTSTSSSASQGNSMPELKECDSVTASSEATATALSPA